MSRNFRVLTVLVNPVHKYVEMEPYSCFFPTAWIGSIGVGVAYVGTIISPRLVQKYGNKTIASIGLGLLVSGCLATSFMPCIEPIYFTFSVLVGMGTNLASISGYVLTLRYFPNEYASRATSFGLIGTTTGELQCM